MPHETVKGVLLIIARLRKNRMYDTYSAILIALPDLIYIRRQVSAIERVPSVMGATCAGTETG